MTKPFFLAVLWARVKKKLLRNRRAGAESLYRQGAFAQLEFSRDGQNIELTSTEQRLLRLLVGNCGRVLTQVIDGGFVEESYDETPFLSGSPDGPASFTAVPPPTARRPSSPPFYWRMNLPETRTLPSARTC